MGFCLWRVHCLHNNVPCIHILHSRGNLHVYSHLKQLIINKILLPGWPSFRIVPQKPAPFVFRWVVLGMTHQLCRTFETGLTCIIPAWPSVVRLFFSGMWFHFHFLHCRLSHWCAADTRQLHSSGGFFVSAPPLGSYLWSWSLTWVTWPLLIVFSWYPYWWPRWRRWNKKSAWRV